MNAVHDEILATIERRALTDGVPPAELDDHTADVLGVPRDHLAAWQLVCGAITSYAQANTLPPSGGRPAGPRAATIAGQLTRLWEHLGAIHQAAVAGDQATVVGEQARELIGELFVLTDWLLTDPDPRSEAPGVGQGVARG